MKSRHSGKSTGAWGREDEAKEGKVEAMSFVCFLPSSLCLRETRRKYTNLLFTSYGEV